MVNNKYENISTFSFDSTVSGIRRSDFANVMKRVDTDFLDDDKVLATEWELTQQIDTDTPTVVTFYTAEDANKAFAEIVRNAMVKHGL